MNFIVSSEDIMLILYNERYITDLTCAINNRLFQRCQIIITMPSGSLDSSWLEKLIVQEISSVGNHTADYLKYYLSTYLDSINKSLKAIMSLPRSLYEVSLVAPASANLISKNYSVASSEKKTLKIIPHFLRTVRLSLNSNKLNLISTWERLERREANCGLENKRSDSKIVQAFHQGALRQLIRQLIVADEKKWWSSETTKMVEECSMYDYEIPLGYARAVKSTITYIQEIIKTPRYYQPYTRIERLTGTAKG